MTRKLDDKVAIVTGGTSGIGLATARRFAEEGARVFITGRRRDVLDKAVKEIGHDAVGIQGDTANLADLDRLYDAVQQRHGQIDILFANAGGGEFAPLGQIGEAHYEKTFDANVKGVLFTVQKALPLLRDGASIILNSSTTGTKGTPAFSVYSATKAAVRNFARNWMLDLKDRHIRVNAVSPGPIATPGLHALAGEGEQRDAILGGLTALIPLGRLGQADEVARAVAFLASDDASFVNGIELFVDGGMAQY